MYQVEVIAIIHEWVCKYPEDFACPTVQKLLRAFIQENEAAEPRLSEIEAKLSVIWPTQDDKAGREKELATDVPRNQVAGELVDERELSYVLLPGSLFSARVSLMDVDSLEIARQITLISARQFTRLQSRVTLPSLLSLANSLH